MTKHLSRRDFLKGSALTLGAAALSGVTGGLESAFAAPQESAQKKAAVYFTKDLSPEGLRKVYACVNQGITGKTAIKLHTGEPNGPYIIPPAWVQAFMPSVPNSAIVECNVLYDSPRKTTAGHRQTLETNGWSYSPVDIMDADGDVSLPIRNGKWIKEVAIGKNMVNYDSMLVLTHFKGHALGGFGGSLKNISIGCASGQVGKAQVHGARSAPWITGPELMERLAEGGKAVTDYFGPRITYINVLKNMSIRCDCGGVAAPPPTAPDLGILASTDILAIDQASVDMVYALPQNQKADLVERIESRSGLHQLTYMKELGMGRNSYEIINV
ncbi:DUF362 domain-containing protein [Desulfovibrio sp.]|uniref:DUF362 domain-containing protein n=1 Tax=Desulfovibrio sp. TaxID=885 RepID=UPI0025C633EB|nr:DUF362 domain-containing protein [Desulfovibrio sp.]